jgi:hypothetical protein
LINKRPKIASGHLEKSKCPWSVGIKIISMLGFSRACRERTIFEVSKRNIEFASFNLGTPASSPSHQTSVATLKPAAQN